MGEIGGKGSLAIHSSIEKTKCKSKPSDRNELFLRPHFLKGKDLR